jgi:uncharacterized damage-inducible protein DinB
MRWANNSMITALENLDPAVLAHFAHDPEYTVGYLVAHIAKGGDWYRHIIARTPFEDIRTPSTRNELEALKNLIYELDSFAVDASLLEESEHVVPNEDPTDSKIVTKSRTMVISQAIHHATEHRAQLVDTLNRHNIFDINCDRYDLWSYDDYLASK